MLGRVVEGVGRAQGCPYRTLNICKAGPEREKALEGLALPARSLRHPKGLKAKKQENHFIVFSHCSRESSVGRMLFCPATIVKEPLRKYLKNISCL